MCTIMLDRLTLTKKGAKLKRSKKPDESPNTNTGMVWAITGIIFFLSLLLGLIVWSTVSVLSQSEDTGGVPADTSVTERTLIEVDDPYLVEDGNSIILIEPTPTGGVIFYRAVDPETNDWIADRGGIGRINPHTKELEIFSEFDLTDSSVLKRKNLREYEHTLEN